MMNWKDSLWQEEVMAYLNAESAHLPGVSGVPDPTKQHRNADH